MRPVAIAAVAAAWMVAGCAVERLEEGDPALGDRPESIALVPAVDSSIPPAIAGEAGWNYQRSASVDLDADGVSERVVLTARVELYGGRPAWDDGQPWQVYVEAANGERTYLYAQRLQLGTLDMRVTEGDSARLAAVVLIEHLPDRLRVLEVRSVNGELVMDVQFERALDPRGELASPRLP